MNIGAGMPLTPYVSRKMGLVCSSVKVDIDGSFVGKSGCGGKILTPRLPTDYPQPASSHTESRRHGGTENSFGLALPTPGARKPPATIPFNSKNVPESFQSVFE